MTRLPGAVRVGAWLLIGQAVAFVVATILAVRELGQLPSLPADEFDPAEVDRFHAAATSITRDRITYFVLLAVGCVVVGSLLLRRRRIGPRVALLLLNLLLVAIWAHAQWAWIKELDGPDLLFGMTTGLGYFGVSAAVIFFVVDILALSNPSTLPEPLDQEE